MFGWVGWSAGLVILTVLLQYISGPYGLIWRRGLFDLCCLVFCILVCLSLVLVVIGGCAVYGGVTL